MKRYTALQYEDKGLTKTGPPQVRGACLGVIRAILEAAWRNEYQQPADSQKRGKR